MDEKMWSEVVANCYDKGLDGLGEVVKTIYSDDKEERAVILQQLDGLYQVVFQKLYLCEYEICGGLWQRCNDAYTVCIVDTPERAIKLIMSERPFKYNR